MDAEDTMLANLIEEDDKPEPLSKVLLTAGGAICLLFVVCIILASMIKTPSISKIDMPSDSALSKPKGEVAGTNIKEVVGPIEPPKTSPTETPDPTAEPTAAPSSQSPTSTPTPTTKPADPTSTPEPTHSTGSGSPTATPTPTVTPTSEPSTSPTPLEPNP